ncbi:MAG: NAD(P)H-dependent oxidoreductase [Methylococcales bacterium]|jgi:NAD(P)H-dependent FMN reductase|nr:NAD(P)H-dependent oxidoreductase [Methylococcales bacterium]MBT7445757.1 NAD(P)H-dependent oxidoreductase [Methylococcales bacterium]
MKITIVSGSHRAPSQSEKVARYLESVITKENDNVEVYFYNLANNPLPLWDQSIWESDQTWIDRLAPIKEELASSDAFIFVVPEWHGMVPSGFKNFLLMFNRFELGHKPALITSVSSGIGGTYPVTELRMNSSKNNRLCYIPESLIIRNVEQVLNEDPKDNTEEEDSYYRGRISWCLDILVGYADALKAMREKITVHHDDYSNGM